MSPSNIYPTRDGTYVLIAGNADNVFRRLAAALGHPEWAEDPRYATHHARGENMEDLDGKIAAWTERRTVDEVLGAMNEAGVPAGKIFTARDMMEDPHYAARGNIVWVDDPEIGKVPMQNVVPCLTDTPGQVRWTGPALGEHNTEVYEGLLGLGDAERADLQARGVI